MVRKIKRKIEIRKRIRSKSKIGMFSGPNAVTNPAPNLLPKSYSYSASVSN
jgi:hypothetical protein